MNISDIYNNIINRFLALPGIDGLLDETVTVIPDTYPEKTLMPENDPPSLVSRPEYRVTAKFLDSTGEAYTEQPEGFNGTLKEVLNIKPDKNGINAVVISSINAVMSHMGFCPGTFSDEPEVHIKYAEDLFCHVSEKYGNSNIVLVGYDGYIVKKFVDEGMDFWTMDRNPDNITKNRFNHVIVNSAKLNRESSFVWARLLIVTGSSLCNGTIVQYLDSGKDLLFYGITCAGTAVLLGLPWFSV